MSTPTPTSAAAPAKTPHRFVQRQEARRFSLFRFLSLIVVLGALSLVEPHCFRLAVGTLLRIEAWRHGVHAQIHRMQGSFFEPVTLEDSVWIYESADGPVTRIEIKEARADLSWRDLLSRDSSPWFRELTLDGVVGKIELPISKPAGQLHPRWMPSPSSKDWWKGPARVAARNVNFIFESDGDYVRLQNASFSVSGVEPGEIEVGQLLIKQPWLHRGFRNVRGTTKFADGKTELASVILEPGVEIQNLSAELPELACGRLNLEMEVAAFGGDIRIETRTIPHNRQLAFEATGQFSQIGISKLAAFLGQSEASGGTIKAGNFKFRGSPQSPAAATSSLRLEATNFQWESRQWDSLILGLSLMGGQLQIPELTLHQGHNFLNLNGEVTLPVSGEEWWQNEFSLNLNARIDNLTELSALLLPEFTYAAGKGTIDGSIRGKSQQFHGQIIVSGSDLTWRSAPIDELHATLKLNGNELELANLSVFNDGDYLRGRGVVNILGNKQYWGELRGSIDELGKYAALLQKPLIPEALAGGAMIDWTGEGSAKGHTGKFLARLHKVRSLGASATLLHPINAELEGTYQPGTILFNQFALSDDSSSFTAHVAVGASAVSFGGLRFVHGNVLQLEGDALLPLDLWQRWPNTSLSSLLNAGTVSKIRLVAHDLDLHAAALLTGWNFPLEGHVAGELTGEGALGNVQSSGNFKLTSGVIPIGWSGLLLTGVEAAGSLSGQHLIFDKATGRHPTGDFRLGGVIDFSTPRNCGLKFSLSSDRTLFPLFGDSRSLSFTGTGVALEISGRGSSALVSGSMELSTAALRPPNLSSLLLGSGAATLADLFGVENASRTVPAPWNEWRFDVRCDSPQPIALQPMSGNLAAHLRFGGSGGAPELSGNIVAEKFPASVGRSMVLVNEAKIEFKPERPLDPALSMEISGFLFGDVPVEASGRPNSGRAGSSERQGGEPFTISAEGPMSHLLKIIECAPPLSAEMVRSQLEAGTESTSYIFGLQPPVAAASGTPEYAWTPIESPSEPSTPQESDVARP